MYNHICAHCFTLSNKTFPHSEVDCRNKKKSSSENQEVRARVMLVFMPIDLVKFMVHKLIKVKLIKS